MWKFLIATILFLFPATIQAQIRSYIRFSTNQGLAGDNIYALQQDKDGFIWIATETGVSRYDGTGFKTFTVKDGLPGNDVPWLFIDKKRRVWMGSFNDALCYYYRGAIHNKYNDEIIKKIVTKPSDPGHINEENLYRFDGVSFAEDVDGNLFIKCKNEIFYIGSKGNVKKYPVPYTGTVFFKPTQLNNAFPLKIIDSSLWKYIVHDNGREDIYPGIASMDTNTELILKKDGFKKSLIIFRNKKPTEIVINSQHMNTFNVLKAPLILLNTTKGSFIYNVATKSFVDTLLADINVNVSLIDSDSSIWIGTNGGGLFYFPYNGGKNILQPGNHKIPLQVYQFYTYRTELWIGSNNWEFWKLNPEKAALDRKGIVDQMNEQLLFPPRGNLQRNPETGLLNVFREKKGILKYLQNAKSSMNIDDTIIIASHDKILRFLLPNKIIDSLITDERITCAYYREGIYYTGTLKGLYRLPQHSILNALKNLTPIINDAVNSIAYSYLNGLLWVSTSENGVYCIRNDTVIHHFNEMNGLSNSICKCLFTDGSKIYVGTIDGLNIIDPGNGFTIKHYYTLDGLPSNNVNCIYASNNKVWVGTSEGLSVIDCSKTSRNSFFKLTLTQIVVSGKNLAPDTNNITLASGNDNIHFTYSGVSFLSMGKIQYTYRLRGLNDLWQTTDQGYLQYPSLPSGNYTFEIFATNRFGTRSNKLHFVFTIKKKWWEYTWLQVLGISALLGLIFTVMWLRIRKVQKSKQEKIELKEKILELEQLALRARMNPHFIFNSLNSFYQYVIDQDLDGASKFMNDFSKLIRFLFETASLSEIALDKEIDFLSTYMELERTKFNKAFSYAFFTQTDILLDEIIIPSFIIQPFIENAIKHGILNIKDKSGTITIRITSDSSVLTVQIEDSGVGRKYTEELKSRTMSIHNSKGISLITERIALYNRIHQSDVRFEIVDKYDLNVATGTLVTIHFPLKK